MSRLLGTAILAATILFSVSAASAQPASGVSRASAPAASTYVGRRCSGVTCLQGIPTLGVAF